MPKQKKLSKQDRDDCGGSNSARCPIVGIGASAGGLAAFKAFFEQMPSDSGLAFVLVPHLDPSHRSLMVELLARQTQMPVDEVTDDMVIEKNHVYIIPPAKYLSLDKGKLRLSAPPSQSRIDTAIDHFLRSLAEDQQERAIGIVLSGTSSHGTLGLQAIKANGGVAIAQKPATAEYDSMPQSAIDTGIVDYILPPEEMPATLIKYVQHAYVSGAWQSLEPAETDLEQLDRMLLILKARTRHDFRNYRKNMVMRRVRRRMGLNQIDDLADYSEFLRVDLDESKSLFRDMLIGVTGFFREPDAYKVLEQHVFPQWTIRDDSEGPIRVWIPGCSTGEEAYSIAMVLLEQFPESQENLNLQIFATDIDEVALKIARQGRYPLSIAADITPERLQRFFTQTGSYYQVNEWVRELVVFAAQNLISDAPFSKLDLISCRNLLIYLEPEVQQKVISLFHFALNENGYLFLGSSESIGRNTDLFKTVSKKWRVFHRTGSYRREILNFPIISGHQRLGTLHPASTLPAAHAANLAELTRRHLLQDYAPASVLINHKYEVLYFHGPTGDFLEAPTGQPTNDLMSLVRHGLRTKLRAACQKAIREDQPINDLSPRIRRDGSWLTCAIHVKPIHDPKQVEGLLLVTFQRGEPVEPEMADTEAEVEPVQSSLVRHLEYELKETRENLQSTIEDQESSNEELMASNEEIMSMNEELQSANEELESSKEELQSLNEELNTVNSQLLDKVAELDKAHNDMTNLLNSANVATLFLDLEFCIRSFTPATGRLLGLIDSDSGRLISTFATEFISEDLLSEGREVLDTLKARESTLSSKDGHHYLRRTQPYRTADNSIEGLVVTFVDISAQIASETQSRRLAAVLHDSNDAIMVINLDGSISDWNRGAQQLYGYSEAEATNMTIFDLIPPEHQPDMQKIMRQTEAGEQIISFDAVRMASDGKKREVWVSLTPLYDESGQMISIATTERDIGERLELDALKAQTERFLSLVENLPVGAVYRENDRLLINKAGEEITGYRRTELATLDDWFSKLFGEHAAEIRQQYHRDHSAGFPRATGPFEIRRKDGESRYVQFAAYRRDSHEVWIMHDVTRRHEAEAALQDREERLRAIMNSVAEAIIVINRDGIVTDFNNAAKQVFGFSAAEVIGQNVKQLMPPPYFEAHDEYLAHYLKTGEPRMIGKPREMRGRRKDASTFPMLLTVAEIGHLGIFVGVIHDLSMQRDLEKQIANLSTSEREQFGQDIHDGLCQQLMGLSMIATSLKQKLFEQNFSEAETMNRLSLELQQAVKDARALAHGLAPVPVTPEGLEDALTLLAREVSENTGIDCCFEGSNVGELKDRTNAMELYRLAQEAVNNAIKHAGASRIDIILTIEDGKSTLTISDDGSGFDADNAVKEGLGIRIMHYRAGIIGSTLRIESAPGQGTIVRCFPVGTVTTPSSDPVT
jgi:two-component system CheB/CheR fusion protein